MRDRGNNIVLLTDVHEHEAEDDPDIEVEVTVGTDEEKIAAVIYCLSNSKGHTIKSLRACATNYTSIGEKMVRRIIQALAVDLFLVKFDTKLRRWIPVKIPQFKSVEEALKYVARKGIRFR